MWPLTATSLVLYGARCVPHLGRQQRQSEGGWWQGGLKGMGGGGVGGWVGVLHSNCIAQVD